MTAPGISSPAIRAIRHAALCLMAAGLVAGTACGGKKPAMKEQVSLGKGTAPEGTATSSGGTGSRGSGPDGTEAGDGTTEGGWGDGSAARLGRRGGAGGQGTATGDAASRSGSPERGRAIAELKNVLFEFDSDEVTPAARAVIEANAAYLQANPNLRVVLRGHTDDRGTPEYNLSLGDRRANAVLEALVALGIPADRLETVSFGEDLPLDPAETDAARAQNRRVEFFVYEAP